MVRLPKAQCTREVKIHAMSMAKDEGAPMFELLKNMYENNRQRKSVLL